MMDILGALEGNDRGRNKQNILNWGGTQIRELEKVHVPKRKGSCICLRALLDRRQVLLQGEAAQVRFLP